MHKHGSGRLQHALNLLNHPTERLQVLSQRPVLIVGTSLRQQWRI
jgi:hypothetical protein